MLVEGVVGLEIEVSLLLVVDKVDREDLRYSVMSNIGDGVDIVW